MNDAELAVIGCLVQTQAQGEILEEVAPEDFSDPDLGKLFQKLGDIWARTGRLDAVIASSLPEKELVLKCCEAPVSYSAYLHYCRAVRNAAVVARVQSLGIKLATNDLTAQEASDIADQLNAVLAGRRGTVSATAVQGMIEFIRQQSSNKPPEYISTGFSRLDKHTTFSPGDMVVIGARPSNGKTAFSIQLGLNMARKGKRVVFFSLETSVQKIMDRAITCFYELNFDDVKHRRIYIPDYVDPDRFSALPFEVVEASGRSARWIKSEAVRRKADVAIVDYLGLIRGKGNGRYEIVTQISQDLHNAAQETKILFIVLSQLNRAGGSRQDEDGNTVPKIPSVIDLRESGQVEQDAECILLLHYKDRQTGEYVVRVGKNKEGQIGDMPFIFRAEEQRFLEVENGR